MHLVGPMIADYMKQAIEKAREGIAAGQTPFGAVVVRNGILIAAAHNTVWRDTDPTAHAEVNTIRLAARSLGGVDLGGTTMYTTCEPCPMCLSAIHWAKIDRVVYGASIPDAAAAGFSELMLGAGELVRLGGSPLQIEGGLLAEECRALFDLWQRTPERRSY